MPANLFLRKVDHPQATDNYRVALEIHDERIEIGSIGPQRTAEVELQWGWGILSYSCTPTRCDPINRDKAEQPGQSITQENFTTSTSK
ncbi:hypothetical protein [Bradyrhizobium sp. JYMT SZCCT0428]|uniref:hypothetical protein n=1 Tax=Bradyrhizobium sp. JYMT SZCCT0428 TaxID=2807673 RepID=UPI001BAD84E4|nr:hypothetical protein [Bradyrhizobium sp. JYMT SZCCT0428]MBR1150059.1 hypothetical protein [Bradyrhizobium sp. JYMT SZCCT0428]